MNALLVADDEPLRLLSGSGLHLSQGLGADQPAACQGLHDGESLAAAAWEESNLAGSRGSASKGPGIVPRALAITSRGDLVRLAMLPGPQSTSRCQVKRLAIANLPDNVVLRKLMTPCSLTVKFARPALRHSICIHLKRNWAMQALWMMRFGE